MKILLVSANFRPNVGGIERFTELLASGLVRRGHRVSVVCCQAGDAPRREDAGFAVERIPASYALHRRINVPFPVPSPVALYRAIAGHMRGTDIVHVQEVLSATSAAALLLARRRALPTVITQHVGFVPQRTAALDAVERTALATVGRCAHLADTLATYNPSVAEWATRRWPGLDVRVLPVGVPESLRPNGDRDTIRRSFGLPVGRFLALFVGRDVPKKGLGIFLAAGHPSYHLVAVADRRAGPQDATMIPFMDQERLQSLLGCVDAFVLPSEAEGFPVALQEALVRRLPVVTTNQPGYERYISSTDVMFVDREAGAVRAALVELAGDKALQRHLAERSADVAKRHFGVDRFVDAYEALYAELCASRRAVGSSRRATRSSRGSSRKASSPSRA
jgi:D-inositol-3-phosphate glycosyltransferase